MAGRNDKTGHPQCCKNSGPPLTQSVREALEGSSKDPRILKFNAEELSLSVYKYADYDSKEISRRSISGAAAMYSHHTQQSMDQPGKVDNPVVVS